MGDYQTQERPSRSRVYHTQNDENVRVYYNSVKNSNRSRTKMMQLRDYNNFIKWLLIFEFSRPYEVALDMACGKGGDLEKWRRAGIDGLIGVDIADISIENAKERYQKMKPKTYWVDFLVGNCFGDSFDKIIHPNALPVDVVSCQFALHYAFDTIDRLRQTLSNVSMALRPGGRFFGTVPNSKYLEDKLKQGQTSWGNNIFNIKFDEDTIERFKKNGNKFSEIAGNQYTFFLSEAVEDVPEYVVVFDKFVELAQSYNLKLITRVPFLEYFEAKVRESEAVLNEAVLKRLTGQTGVPTFDPEQLEVCSIYLVFAFEKI